MFTLSNFAIYFPYFYCCNITNGVKRQQLISVLFVTSLNGVILEAIIAT